MIIVYGTRKKLKKIKDLGPTTCTNCGHNVMATLNKEGGYCHLCYIPVFPYTMGYKFIGCPNCGIAKKLTGAEYKELKNKEE